MNAGLTVKGSSDRVSTLKAPVPPPALFFVLLIAGAAIDTLHPLRFLSDEIGLRLLVSLPLFVLAVAIGIWAFWSFRRSRTSPDFGSVVSALVQRGPYRFSRNPLYVALVLVLAGLACVLNNGWLAIATPLLVVALDRVVIVREERFLADLFGSDYGSYRARVRRWC
jgi:protein-S-isoprenylcysteine O-methyltransferase Ste14